MGLSFELTAVTVGVLAYALVLAVLRTLAGRVSLILTRHDLLVASKRRRIAFHQEQQQMRSGEQDDGDAYDVIIEDDPPLKAAA